MFGTNPIAELRNPRDGFLVNSIFYTIQGEGPWAGLPALFVRMSGCNLRCHFCDTEFTTNTVYALEALVGEIKELMARHRATRIVWTGGEPLLQDISLLIARLPGAYSHQIETAGSIPGPCSAFYDLNVLLVISPKTPIIAPALLQSVHMRHLYFKYIIRAGDISPLDHLPVMSTQRRGHPSKLARPPAWLPKEQVFLQAMDEAQPGKEATISNRLNLEAAAHACLNTGYRLSVQMHKLAGLD